MIPKCLRPNFNKGRSNDKNKLFSPINQWLAVNKELKLYQVATIFLFLLSSILVLLLFWY